MWPELENSPRPLTGGAGGQAAILGRAAATSRVILVLGASHHEIRQGAWDILGKVLGEFRLGDQGVLLKITLGGLEGTSEAMILNSDYFLTFLEHFSLWSFETAVIVNTRFHLL